MFEGNHIQVGAGRYFQHHGALKLIGKEVMPFGKKIYLLFADETVKQKVEKKIINSLGEQNIGFVEETFTGPSTERSFYEVAERIKEQGCQLVAGIGGGRVIDIAKAAGDMLDIPIFTVPTSAATCAAYAVLYVVYGEDGHVDRSEFLKHEISGVIVDLDVVADDCPKRFFASGIADAMAKKPEFLFTMQRLGKEGMASTSEIATMIADYTYSHYMQESTDAVKQYTAKEDSMLVDNFINMNIMLTGMVSDLSTGGKQLAIAHNFYDAICFMHKNIRKQYLHGEIVGLAIPLQMSVNGSSDREIKDTKELLRTIGIPVSLKEVGFPMDQMDTLIEYVGKVTVEGDTALLEQIGAGMNWIL